VEIRLISRPRVADDKVPEMPGPICTNKESVSIPAEFKGSKYLQDLHYGSPEWKEMHTVGRQTMEGYNGYVKHGGKGAMKDPSRRLLRGFTAQFFLVAFQILQANMLLIDAWLLRRPKMKARAAKDALANRRSPRRPGLSRFRSRRELDPGLDRSQDDIPHPLPEATPNRT
jgi:hypothetical protein